MQNGYRCFDLKTDHIYISHNVVFDEGNFPFTDLSSSTTSPTTQNKVLLSIPTIQHDKHTSSTNTTSNNHSNILIVSHSIGMILPVESNISNTNQGVHIPSKPSSQHPMTTRSKDGTRKSKVFFSTKHPIP